MVNPAVGPAMAPPNTCRIQRMGSEKRRMDAPMRSLARPERP